MIVLVETESGTFAVDLETEELEPSEEKVEAQPVSTGLPRVVASAQSGATIVAVVDASPPLLVSRDAGSTWNEAGRGLPSGFAVAIGADDPDLIVYAARNRLHLSTTGGTFWQVLAPELPAIRAVELREA